MKKPMDLLEGSIDTKNLRYCLECGTCTASCPVANVASEQFNPRNLLLKVFLDFGMRDRVFSSETMWLCSGCYNCQERCPSGIDVADIIITIRNVAVLEKNLLPKGVLDQGREVVKTGRLMTPTTFVNRQREELGLEKAPTEAVEEALSLIKKTGFDKLVSSLE